jgi:peptidoglycan-N-acetylglucosamine deacetylase
MTPETFDLLLEFGFEYDSSCMGDDRPYMEAWEGRSILEPTALLLRKRF